MLQVANAVNYKAKASRFPFGSKCLLVGSHPWACGGVRNFAA